MQRTLLIVLATAVVAAGVAATATIVLTGDDTELVISTPSPDPATPAATIEVATAAPDATGSPPAGSPAATTRPVDDGDDEPTASPTRSAASVDCDEEPEFCSAADQVIVEDGKQAGGSEGDKATPANRPTITLSSDIQKSDDGDVEKIKAEVLVENETDETFHFPRREIVLDVYRNGRLWERLVTKGPGFDMTPGGRMNGSFEQPIFDDGTYRWEAKVWYQEK